MLLTSTEDMTGQQKENSEDHLSPTNMSSVEVAKSGDKGDDSHITRGEVTEYI